LLTVRSSFYLYHHSTNTNSLAPVITPSKVEIVADAELLTITGIGFDSNIAANKIKINSNAADIPVELVVESSTVDTLVVKVTKANSLFVGTVFGQVQAHGGWSKAESVAFVGTKLTTAATAGLSVGIIIFIIAALILILLFIRWRLSMAKHRLLEGESCS